jgi:HK97 family phage portal protein
MLTRIARWLGYVPAGDGPQYRTLENPAVPINDPDAWRAEGWMGSESDAGESVTPESMLSVPAVWQAVGMISGDVSKIPLEVFRRDGDDRDQDFEHPAYGLISLSARANAETSALMLWRRMLVHALIWPRGYVWIDRRGDGAPIGLYNLLPDRTVMERIGGRLWVVTEVGGRLEAIPWDDVLILENISIDQVSAFGPVRAARHNVGLQLAKRKFTSKFFSNGCHAGGVLQVPPGASDPARKKVEDSIKDKRFSKDNAFKTLVLRDGFKFHTTMVNPSDSQANEIEEAEVRNVARFYRLAPSRLGVSESISYNSEEAARRAYHDETLSYWLIGIKTEANIKLLTEEQRRRRTHFIDYNIAALNWADTTTVVSVGVQGVNSGIFSRDEVRRWLNYNSIPDGEGSKFLIPLNLAPVGETPADPPDDQQRAAVLDALRGLVRNTVDRMVTLINGQAQRAASKHQLDAWRQRMAESGDKHLSEIASSLEAMLEACGLRQRDVAGSLITAYCGDLQAAQERIGGADPWPAVEEVSARYSADAGEALATQWIDM